MLLTSARIRRRVRLLGRFEAFQIVGHPDWYLNIDQRNDPAENDPIHGTVASRSQ